MPPFVVLRHMSPGVALKSSTVTTSQLQKLATDPHLQYPGTLAMESNAEIQDLFSKSEYSDLTIKLSDGQEFRVHKFIVCMRNEYFLKLCGLQSRFAVSLTA